LRLNVLRLITPDFLNIKGVATGAIGYKGVVSVVGFVASMHFSLVNY